MGSVAEVIVKPRQNPDTFLNNNVFDLFSLKGRTVVITGGGRGIGLAMGYAVAEAGGNVAIIDAAEEPHKHFLKLKEDMGIHAEYYRSDVTDYAKLETSFNRIVDDFGRIDGLITAAGICPDEAFVDRKPESVARCMNINVLGTYYSAQLAARQMQRQEPSEANPKGGSIVLIASIAAYVASKGQNTSDYCASKGAVLSLAKALGVELAASAIRVNSISPGYMMTDMTLDLIAQYPHLGEIMQNEPPMRRMGDRTDLKGLTVYLLSRASAYQTSSDTLVTGGIHAGRLMT